MDQKHIDDFAVTYYYFSCLTQEELNVGGLTVKFDEPMDCFLWYLKLLNATHPNRAMPRMQIMNLVYCWFRQTTTIERAFKRLKDNELICSKRADELGKNARASDLFVWLTPTGGKLLKKIKDKRSSEWLHLFENLEDFDEKEKETLLRLLEKISNSAQKQTFVFAAENPYGKAKDAERNRKNVID